MKWLVNGLGLGLYNHVFIKLRNDTNLRQQIWLDFLATIPRLRWSMFRWSGVCECLAIEFRLVFLQCMKKSIKKYSALSKVSVQLGFMSVFLS